MSHRAVFVATLVNLAAAWLLAAAPAQAQDCGGLKQLANIRMVPIHRGTAMLVPVTINGTPRRLLLDTGGYISQLTRSAVQSLQLEDHPSILHLYDVAGNTLNRFVSVKELTLGTLRAANLEMPVAPDPQFGVSGEPYDGILSSNLLLAYDVEIDYGSNTLNYFSPDHCPGKVIYWNASAVAVVPITVKDESRIMIPITLDGHDFTVFVDTGAANTFMSLPVAQRIFGLTPDSPGMVARPGVNNDKSLMAYGYVFHTLTFGDITVNNPHVALLPDVMNRNGDKSEQTGNRALLNNADVTLPQLTLGMDVLRHLHIYMAFRERKLYITPASAPQAPAPAGQP